MPRRCVTYPAGLRRGLAFIVILFAASWAVFPPPLSELDNVSSQVLDREGTPLAVYTIDDGLWRVHTKIEDIDPRFIAALIAVEDERFWTHSGVDVLSIARAFRTLMLSGKARSGASTITMQLVRQIEPRKRVISSKIIESGRALQYNLALSKTDILEHYLTHISYGGNIQGLGAASHIYFGKTPAHLTWSEIAALIALPQAPASRRPRKNDLSNLTAGRDKVLAKLVRQKVITQQQADEARAEPLDILFANMPRSRDAVIAKLSGTRKNYAPVVTTLDTKLQTRMMQVVSARTRDWPKALNGAAIIVHNPSGEVRAVSGAMAPQNDGGWIDLTAIKRSPGSALKPFIYGLAMDDGLIDRSTLLPDTPQAFDGYKPENFDRTYYGEVRVHEALRHSLNIPAVAVMQQLGAPRFEAMLDNAGVSLARSTGQSEKAGLAIALGGTAITPRDLAMLYSGLANSGQTRALKWQSGAADIAAQTVLSATTTDEITQILRYAPGPKGRAPHWLKAKAHAVSYKTGTSYGFRDAWAVGYTAQWTVLIWVGRPDGGASPGQTGRNMAAPIMNDIFEQLPGGSAGRGYRKDPLPAGGLHRLIESQPKKAGPEFSFPEDGAVILAKDMSRGVQITLKDESSAQVYVNGMKIPAVNEQWIWQPQTAGFYDISGVNADGKTRKIRVRVLMDGY